MFHTDGNGHQRNKREERSMGLEKTMNNHLELIMKENENSTKNIDMEF